MADKEEKYDVEFVRFALGAGTIFGIIIGLYAGTLIGVVL